MGHIVILAPNWTHLGLFQIRFYYSSVQWLSTQIVLKSDLKSLLSLSHFGVNLTHFDPEYDPPAAVSELSVSVTDNELRRYFRFTQL